MILAHFTQGDVPSMGLVLGLAFLFMGGRSLLRAGPGERGWRTRGARQAGLGLVCLLIGLIAGLR